VSITGDSYVLSLSKVHFVVLNGSTSSGSFMVDGTITTKAPLVTKGFSWKENGGTVTKTATSASFTNQYKTIYAKGSALETIFEINLTSSIPGTYTLDGSANALAYVISKSAMFQASSGSVVITKNAALKMSGTFQATGTAAGGITTVSGTFTDIDVVP
jgi:glutamate 5-kinase